MAKNCVICGNKVAFLGNYTLKDGKMCENCGASIGLDLSYAALSVAERLTSSDVINYQKSETKIDSKQRWEEIKTAEKKAKADNKIKDKAEKDANKRAYKDEKQLFLDHGARVSDKMHADFKDKKVLFEKGFMVDPRTVDFTDIVSYSPITSGHGVSKHHRGARGITGGLIAGPIGAVVGASTGGKDYDVINDVHITINFKDGTARTLKYVNTDYKSDSLLLKSLMNDYNAGISILDAILADNQQTAANAADTPTTPTQTIDADELTKLKGLLDAGVITQEDFDAKKKQILGI